MKKRVVLFSLFIILFFQIIFLNLIFAEEFIECDDLCGPVGNRTCDGNGYSVCDDHFGNDECWEWGPVIPCLDNQTCFNGVCRDNECIGRSCSQINKSCGTWDDGCGHNLNCGGCPDNYNCRSGACNLNEVECTISNWQYSLSPLICPENAKQIKSWVKIGNCNGGVVYNLQEEVTCVYNLPNCDYTYSDWGECGENSVKQRDLLGKFPETCQGVPDLTDSCEYMDMEVCEENQIIPCDIIENGVFNGYKNKCLNNSWTNLPTCNLTCYNRFNIVNLTCVINDTVNPAVLVNKTGVNISIGSINKIKSSEKNQNIYIKFFDFIKENEMFIILFLVFIFLLFLIMFVIYFINIRSTKNSVSQFKPPFGKYGSPSFKPSLNKRNSPLFKPPFGKYNKNI